MSPGRWLCAGVALMLLTLALAALGFSWWACVTACAAAASGVASMEDDL